MALSTSDWQTIGVVTIIILVMIAIIVGLALWIWFSRKIMFGLGQKVRKRIANKNLNQKEK